MVVECLRLGMVGFDLIVVKEVELLVGLIAVTEVETVVVVEVGMRRWFYGYGWC